MKSKENILEVKNLEVKFLMNEGTVHAVNGVSYVVPEGKSIGIVGESGCGKTVSTYSILKLLPDYAEIKGNIYYRAPDDEIINIIDLSPDGKKIRKIRGKEISMIFQEPMTSFSPVHTINNQISESLILYCGMNKKEAKERTIELLELVGIPGAKKRVHDFPFQFSGGMRQRAMIALALARNPRILLADEPTTALDVTLQAQILKLIKDIQKEFNLSLILITHDLGVIAHMVDYVYVMYLGTVIESAEVKEIFNNPQHPYTKGLLNSIPRLSDDREKRISSIGGSVPDTYSLPEGCIFKERCDVCNLPECDDVFPELLEVSPNHFVRCYLYSSGV